MHLDESSFSKGILKKKKLRKEWIDNKVGPKGRRKGWGIRGKRKREGIGEILFPFRAFPPPPPPTLFAPATQTR